MSHGNIILDAFFKSTDEYPVFTQVHIESFDHFIKKDLSGIIKSFNPIRSTVATKDGSIRGEIEFYNVRVKPPHLISNGKPKRIHPNYCRNNGSTYNLHVYSDYSLRIFIKSGNSKEMLNREHKSREPLLMAKIPCMILSSECNLRGLNEYQLQAINEDTRELGGYFIISGQERIIIHQENKAPNKIYKNIDIRSGNIEYTCWIQSSGENSYSYPYYTTVTLDHNDKIYVSVSVSKARRTNTPLIIFLRALGVKTDRDVDQLISGGDLDISKILEKSLLSNDGIYSEKEALLRMGKKYMESSYYAKKTEKEESIIKYTQYTLFEQEFLPHIGGNAFLQKKLYFLIHMIRTVINLRLGREKELDRNDYGNKRIPTSGVLYGQLFRYHFNQMIRNELRPGLRKEMNNFNREKRYDNLVMRYYQDKKVSMVEGNIRTGEWPAGKTKHYNVKAGVAQIMERRSPLDTLMFTQKISMPTKKGKGETTNPKERKLHSSQFGVFDPYDTPDGKNIGKIKHKTIMCYITNQHSPKMVRTVLKEIKGMLTPLDLLHPSNIPRTAKIMINGDWTYALERKNLKTVYLKLLDERAKGIINVYTSIICDFYSFELRIWTDAGRLLRPLLTVKRGTNRLKLTNEILIGLKKGQYDWNYLIEKNIVEYIFIQEAKFNALIARNTNDLSRDPNLYRYTHCEISPLAIFSANSGSIALAGYTQAPRITFQNQMGKQSVSAPVTNHRYRIDVDSNRLPDAQVPAISSRMNKYTGSIELPGGTNAIVAVTTAEGFNIEDSIVANKRSVRNGFMDVFKDKTYMDVPTSGHEIFLKPIKEKTDRYKHYSSYQAIASNGLPIKGKTIKNGEILIGKVKLFSRSDRSKSYNPQFEYQDKSKIYDSIDDVVVERVSKYQGQDGNDIVRVKCSSLRKLSVGDKVASTNAQKGTVSLVVEPEDMLFTESGIIPDLVFSPMGLITRMTQGFPIGLSTSIIAAEKGITMDATPFNGLNIQKHIIPEMEKLGYKDHGEEVCYNPKTGEKLKSRIFVGPVYYQRLKHMVNDKVSARDIDGYYSPKTKQPSKGRTKKGGFRIGEMEKDVLMCHGALYCLQEKFYNHSDKFRCYVSKDTGFICVGNPNENIYEDKVKNKNIVQVMVPYCFVRLWTLLMSMGIVMRIETY